MKTVKDTSALNKLALKTGATVSDESGNKFNTAKKKAAAPKRLEPEVPLKAPAPKPEKPVGPDKGSVKVAETIVEVGQSNAKMLEQIKDQIANIRMDAAQPVTRWVFEFKRDSKGYLTQVICDGSPDIKVLN